MEFPQLETSNKSKGLENDTTDDHNILQISKNQFTLLLYELKAESLVACNKVVENFTSQ
jgi:hypothetical protein